jgi:formylglycine-generating enzyme required for sulfatase activity
MDKATWQERIRERLAATAKLLAAMTPGMSYGALSAATILPLVTAVQQGELAAIGALFSIVGGVGGNLIANQIQQWRDKSDAEVAQELSGLAETQPEWRAALDALVLELETPRIVQAILGEAEWERFERLLRQELAKLGNLPKYEVILTQIHNEIHTGGGAVFQGGVQTEGGDVVNRDKITQIYYIYQSAPGPARLGEDEFRRVLAEYLGWAQKAYARARLYGLESVRTAKGRPVRSLSDVFVPIRLRRFTPPERGHIEKMAGEYSADPLAEHKAYLALVDQHRQSGEPVQLMDLLAGDQRLAVIGGAGSGKSTLLAYLAYCLAEHVQTAVGLPFRLPLGVRPPIPLLIPLRYYRQYQEECRSTRGRTLDHPRSGTLAGFVPWYLKRRSPALELSEDFFDRLLLGGGCLLMLDGLDEIVDETERGRVRAQVEDLANDIYPDNRFLVTAREAGYRENAVFGDDFVRLNVQPLDAEQMRALVHNWCEQIYPDEVDDQTSEIVAAIETINERYRRQQLPDLIDTPLMTTMVISVKWGETELPRERAKLYEAAIKVILQAQYLSEDESRDELVGWGGPWEEQREWLAHLALAMQGRGPAGAALPEAAVREHLQKQLAPGQLNAFIRAVRQRGGLLEERAELFQFLHLTFQEYLAARLLAKQRKEAWPILNTRLDDAWWREVLLLHYGFAKTDYPPYAQEFLAWLSNPPMVNDAARLAGRELAAAAVLEIERPEPGVRRLQAEQLAAAITDPTWKTTPAQRAAAGVTLARLGDPRPGVGARVQNGVRVPEIDWVAIKAGPFVMGEGAELFTCTLINEAYRISRYLVTVAQYRCFVHARGYDQKRYWSDAGWRWRSEDKVTGPEQYGEPFDLDNHPQVGVSWYEATAFCRWLSEVLEQEITLPSEAQWERAARFTDGRVYPWNGDFSPERCNMSETGIGATSAVGLFPSGAAQEGAVDMSGNVWEWCSTKWRENYKTYETQVDDGLAGDATRVVRGGSWGYDGHDMRCAVRGRVNPNYRDGSGGFRIVSPGL